MAGIGIKLHQIYSKRSVTSHIYGVGYSMVITIAPMLVVITAVMLMQYLLGFDSLGYSERELYSCTVLYVFIFSLLSTSPFNPILSNYMSDVIFNETFGDIMAAYYVGLAMNVAYACAMGIPFCIWEHVVGGVPIYYVFTGYCAYMALMLVFYNQLYLSISKDYKLISTYFIIGMVVTVLLSLFFAYFMGFGIAYSMLLALAIGFLLIGATEYAQIKNYYRENSRNYLAVLQHFRIKWQLGVTNFFYILGLYIHNFVFWTSDLRMVVVKSFVVAQPYDMATCIAMFTNISASVIFISRVEMYFRDKYKAFQEAIIGGRLMDIENTKSRMFRQLTEELMSMVRIQFIISVVVYMLALTILPLVGMGGLVMRIYPCLAAGYFIMYPMYSCIIFLYYYNDVAGSVMTALSFFCTTFVVAVFARDFPDTFYGMGLVAGAAVGWTVAYFRIRHTEKNIDVHVFCRGSIMEKGKGEKPSNLVYTRAKG